MVLKIIPGKAPMISKCPIANLSAPIVWQEPKVLPNAEATSHTKSNGWGRYWTVHRILAHTNKLKGKYGGFLQNGGTP